ncbi:MAG: SusC/RagA family TonB-linked outer membrane protein [Tannerella sp.]|nr:SusC/RagA family TonB-linked outer membrane protein [Tannerella sp.]
MNLSWVFLLAATLQVTAVGYAQTLSLNLNMDNAPMRDVFKEIERQTELSFIFSDDVSSLNDEVSINVRNKNIVDILDYLFKDSDLGYKILNERLIVVGTKAILQQFVITGRVTDTSGEPIVGVSVWEKGTGNGVMTDANGNYTLQVSGEKAVLVFSLMGYVMQEIEVGNRRAINVTLMENIKELDEAVVIGYGTQIKSELSTAVTTVRMNEISQGSRAGGLAGALQGRIPGVSVESGGGSITIRGNGSLGAAPPLQVVDGSIVTGPLDMDDIESVSILKDAASASIYGSRASNGVIMITTKSGKKNSSPRVRLGATFGATSVPKRIDVLDGKQWTDVMKANINGFADWNGISTNWQDEVYRTGSSHKFSAGFSGGTENFTYDLSGEFAPTQGTFKYVNSSWTAFRIKTGYEKGRLKIGETIMLSDSRSRNIPDGGGQPGFRNVVLAGIPVVPVYDETNDLGGWGIVTPQMKNLGNVVSILASNDLESNSTNIGGSGFVEIRLIDELKYKFNVGLSRGRAYDNNYIKPYRDGNSTVDLGRISNAASFSQRWMIENTLTYDKRIGAHNIGVLAGYTAQKDSTNSFNAGGQGLPNGVYTLGGATANYSYGGSASTVRRVSMLGRVQYAYDYRYLLSASVRRDGSSVFASGYQYGTYPAFSAGWNISNEKFFQSAISPNAVTLLKLRGSWGKQGNDNIGAYVTQSGLTANANYLQNGNAMWLGIYPSGTQSPINLFWETTTSTDFGLDAAFLNNRLYLTADYYVKKSTGLLLAVPVPPSIGLTGSPTVNAGEVENKGFEFAVNYADHGNVFKYDIGFNFSTLDNKMTGITVGGGAQQFSNNSGSGDISRAKVGYPLGGFWLIKTDGIFQSDAEAEAYVDKNGNRFQPNASAGDVKFVSLTGEGPISNADRQYVGSPIPKYEAGLSGVFSYGNFDMNLLFQGVTGNKIYNTGRIWLEKMTEVTGLGSEVLNAWTPTNHSDFPRFILTDPNQNANPNSDRWLEDGGYLRFRHAEIGYSLKSLFKRYNVENFRIFIAGDNLFTLTRYKGINPDIGGGGNPLNRGQDTPRTFAINRLIQVGINISF